MIDRHFILLEEKGYTHKNEAYDRIRFWYSHLSGVTAYYAEGLWYIVQSKSMM